MVKKFNVSSDDALNISFKHKKQHPTIAGVEILSIENDAAHNHQINAGIDLSLYSSQKLVLQPKVGKTWSHNSKLKYSWYQVGGPEEVTLTGANEENPTILFPSAGQYRFKVVVDDGVHIASDLIEVMVVSDDRANDKQPTVLRINSGGGSITGDGGEVWSADPAKHSSAYVNTGRVNRTHHSIDMSDLSISESAPEKVFQTARWDRDDSTEMTWSFPVQPGAYEVKLYFAELWEKAAKAGVRTFDVMIEDKIVLFDYDIYDDVGSYKAVVKTFQTESNENLDIEFNHAEENPSINAIEVVSLDKRHQNLTPLVSTAEEVEAIIGEAVQLYGFASDDGRPNALLSYRWQTDSGPQSVTFLASDSPSTLAIFPVAGEYTVTLKVDDGEIIAEKSIVVKVYVAPGQATAWFSDVSDSLDLPEEHGDYGVFWSDLNNDELDDLIFMGHGHIPQFLQQKEDGTFLNVSAANGIKADNWDYPEQRDRHGGSCADFNNDGFADLYIGHGAMRGATLGTKYDELLKGSGDFTFSNIAKTAGTMNQFGRGRLGTWADYNNDGWLDLYVSNFDSPNVMYKNNGDETFTDVTELLGLAFNASTAAWSDFDNDGFVDLLLASPIRLLRNTGNHLFEDVTQKSIGKQNLFGYGLAWTDIDSDGDQDFVVSRLGSEPWIFVNHELKFQGSPLKGVNRTQGLSVSGISPADIDNDGDIDLILNTSEGIQSYLNDGELNFTQQLISSRLKNSSNVRHGDIALADFNHDGMLDFASDDVDGYFLFKNETVNSNNWLQIDFEGIRNNAMGIGNKVKILVEGEVVASTQYYGSVAGLRSFGCSVLHLGLKDHGNVTVLVEWPNGFESKVENVRANQRIVIGDM